MSATTGKYLQPLGHSYLNKKHRLLGFEKKIDKLNFLPMRLSKVDVSLASALRRVFMSEIPNAALHSSDIKIRHNTSQYNTEVLMDRFSMIYLNSNEIQNYDLADLIFFISDVENPAEPLKNNTQAVIKIWAHDHLRIELASSKAKIDTKKLVAHNQLLFTLNPGESVHAMMKASMGIGLQSVIWHSAVAINKNETPLDSIPDGPVETNEQKMAYLGYENSKPESFILTVESIGKYDSNKIVNMGIDFLKQKLESLKQELLLEDKAPNIKIKSDPNIPRLITITIPNESHTLGNLLEAYGLIKLHDLISATLKVNETGPVKPSSIMELLLECRSDYRQPHPLEKKMVYTARIPTKYDLVFPSGKYDEIIDPTVRMVILTIDHLQDLCDQLAEDAKLLL